VDVAATKHVEGRSGTPDRRWRGAGQEPGLAELLDDPIAELLRRRDGLTRADVEGAVRLARQRVTPAETGYPRPAPAPPNINLQVPDGS
jgi:hypothetical protein